MESLGTMLHTNDLTTKTQGANGDAEPLVYRAPRVMKCVPGQVWKGPVGEANAVIRFPDKDVWNGKLLIGGIPAVRNEYSLDLLLGDIALQRGYAFATCDKATPGITLRNPERSMAEWKPAYLALIERAQQWIANIYQKEATRTYLAGVSNGGYVVRMMMEQHPELFDGAVEWEGVLWRKDTRHLLTTLPVYVADYPVYANWRGDRSISERSQALDRLLEAGLVLESSSSWDTYFMVYWVVSLWLYGRSLDPNWGPFALEWTNDWLRDPSPIAHYPWLNRKEELARRITPIENTGELTKPMLSVAGNWDCLVPFLHHAKAYADLVAKKGAGRFHRLYEIERGNHVDGMLRSGLCSQQPVQPYFEAAFYALEDWVECGIEPPPSGRYATVGEFTRHESELLSVGI